MKGGCCRIMKTKEQKSVFYVSMIGLFLILFCLLRAAVILHSSSENASIPTLEKDYSPLEPIQDGWILVDSDGNASEAVLPCTLQVTAGETVTLFHAVSAFDEKYEVLQFDNYRQSLRVRADDMILYEVNCSKLRNQLMFTDYHILEIPRKAEHISFEFIASGSVLELPEIYCTDLYSARYQILKNDLPTLIILCIFGLLALVIFGIGGYYFLKKQAEERWVPLGIFLSLAFIWGYTDSYLPVLTNIPQEILGLMSYFSVQALPLPMAAFLWISCGKKGKSLPVIMIIGATNLILQAVFSLLGWIHLNQTFFAAHVLSIATIIIAFMNLIPCRKKAEDKQELNMIVAGSFFLSLGCVLSIITYWMEGKAYYRIFLLSGVILFLSSLSSAIIVHHLRKLREEELRLSEMKISEKLSFYDQLTGMANRRSYEKKLIEVETECKEDEDAVLIMMDVNGLKITNDTYGHSAGDDLIVAASQVIRAVYESENNSCYRIGGDEFVVIMRHPSVSELYYDKKLEDAIREKNNGSLWKLSIARGASHLLTSTGRKMSITDWKQEADVRMYQNKMIMTAGKNRDRAKDFSDIIDCIVSTVEAKDRYTASHSDRVRRLSWMIGEKLGVSGLTLSNLETAAHLHDIGKIGIPDNVLSKPGKLTDEEFALMKRHSAIGAEIIGKASGMKDISEIILHHHERYDGKGYPDHLKCEEIPLESRIIAIADSIDAMTSKRVYRDSMSLDACRKEIEINIGKMYDPAIARIVLDNWTEVEEIVLLHPKRLLLKTE